MRADMAKVIVERPRHGGGISYPRGHGNKRDGLELEYEIRREGMRRPWLRTSCAKGLNENLAPLRRYLQSNVGRPWNKVHSEICERMNLNSAVQLHIWQHLKDYVCMHPIRSGRDWLDARGKPLWEPFLVDPKCGLLRKNETNRWWTRHKRQRHAETPSPNFIAHKDGYCLRRIDGIWYEFGLSPIPADRAVVFDVALKRKLREILLADLIRFHGRAVYATSKRQLNSKELRRLIPVS
jgi:hypothetical protein